MTRFRTIALASVAAVLAAVLAVQAQVPGVNSTLNSVFTLVYDASTMKPSYSATASVVPVSSATDICTLTGSSTKTVKVRQVKVTGIANAVSNVQIGVLKRSTANAGGNALSTTPTAYDSTNSLSGSTTNTATATFRTYASNPSTGTLVGYIADPYITLGNGTTGFIPTYAPQVLGLLASPVVLRGTSQVLAVNLGGVSVTSGNLSCTIEWTEE